MLLLFSIYVTEPLVKPLFVPVALLTSTLSVAVGQRQSVCGVDLSLAVASSLLLVLLLSVLNGHLAELSSEVGRALTLVPGTALATIHARQVAHH